VGQEVPQTITAAGLDIELLRRKLLLKNSLHASIAGMVLPLGARHTELVKERYVALAPFQFGFTWT
jgi:hypothetical protein